MLLGALRPQNALPKLGTKRKHQIVKRIAPRPTPITNATTLFGFLLQVPSVLDPDDSGQVEVDKIVEMIKSKAPADVLS